MAKTFSWAQYLPTITIPVIVNIIIAIVTMITARLIIKAIQPTIEELCSKNKLESHTCYLINKIIEYTIIAIAATIALQNLGVNVSMLITTLGITGFILAYGVKDIIANFVSGILILAYKQFKINDYIKIKDWEGKVIDINLRYTTIEYQNMIIFIPNMVLYSNTVAVIKE